MEIKKQQTDSVLNVALSGRLDTVTAPELDASLKDLSGVTELILDFAQLSYISSAGLRVILALQKAMSRQGSMKLTHVSSDVMEVFEITGFCDILTIE